MTDLKITIGKNLSTLRKKKGLTQSELAEKLNYSDKAISKWEHGDAMPSIDNLVNICKFYEITLDQLTQEDISNIKLKDTDVQDKTNKIIITLLSFFTVWTLATVIYVAFIILKGEYQWTTFIWALPLSCVVLIVFNSIWGKRKANFALITCLIWTILLACYLECLVHNYNLWVIFLIGIPGTIVVILWSKLKLK